MDGDHSIPDFYHHYKFYHFFAICFGLGCGMGFYRPYYSVVMPAILAVFFVFAFECVGVTCDAVWGFTFALLVAILYLRSYHVYTLSYGTGIAVFALRGAVRKYNALWRDRC